MRLFVVRHGETAANAARVLQTPDVPLSERGLAQAERLARRLAGEELRLVLSSDLRRAAMTAELVARASGVPLRFDPLLQERSFGDWRGTTYAELGIDPYDPELVPPGGESFAVFHERTARAFAAVERAVREAGGPVAVITHGLVCRDFVMQHLDPSGTDHPRSWGNTSVTEASGLPWRIVRVNCLAHLEGEKIPERDAAPV